VLSWLRSASCNEVGREKDGAALVALADDLEEQVSPELVDGEVPELIDDQQARGEVSTHGALERACGDGGAEGVDDVDGGGEEHGVAAQAGGVTEREGQMRFAQTHAAQKEMFLCSMKAGGRVLDLRRLILAGSPTRTDQVFTNAARDAIRRCGLSSRQASSHR
jgi:hypothetical protein